MKAGRVFKALMNKTLPKLSIKIRYLRKPQWSSMINRKTYILNFLKRKIK